MIDAGIEAEFLGHVTAFLWSSGDADDAGTLDPGDLVKKSPNFYGGGESPFTKQLISNPQCREDAVTPATILGR
jgi:hypothetical protein